VLIVSSDSHASPHGSIGRERARQEFQEMVFGRKVNTSATECRSGGMGLNRLICLLSLSQDAGSSAARLSATETRALGLRSMDFRSN
jgi:hypothetical protein